MTKVIRYTTNNNRYSIFIATTSTDVYENNETNINNNIVEFVMNQISLLTDMLDNFIEFENDMKSLVCQNIYLYLSNNTNDNYIKEIESIFKNDGSLSFIQKKWRKIFLCSHKICYYQLKISFYLVM